ncbi:cadmium resistance transporter [Ornithinibacillus scapharcae]|uniref:cadmium resistance transporter n=1 Tax=Ornithinibacillus scapharcae TaxID=1147159 RepID=UPI000225B840|nr:cadmium resistance transporter [Ornithinibacillus scapharcae]
MGIILTTVVLFVATNIDDIFLLMAWFSQRDSKLKSHHIVFGQYVGFILLLIVSMVGSLGTFLISKEWIGLLGLVPIYLGGKAIVEQYRERKESLLSEREGAGYSIEKTTGSEDLQVTSTWRQKVLHPSVYKVAAVTFANGGDNIGVYIPFLATYNSGPSISLIIFIFLLLVAAWCYISFKLVSFPVIAQTLDIYGHIIIPFVLIGLGFFILHENRTFT